MFGRRHFESKSINTVVRKAFSVTFALVFILCSLGVGCTFAGACSVRCHMLGTQHRIEAKGSCHLQGCCCGANKPLCDVSKGCASELPEFALSAVPTVKKSTPAHTTVNTTYVSSSFDFPVGLDNTVWTLAIGPPVPLFLLNLSLLR